MQLMRSISHCSLFLKEVSQFEVKRGGAGQSEPSSCRRAGATRADHSSHGALVLGEECVTGLFMTHLIGFGRLEFRMYRRPHTTDSFYSFF